MNKLIKILFVFIFCISLIGCSSKENNNETTLADQQELQEEVEQEEEQEEADKNMITVSYGESFIFDDMEITFQNEISWHTIENQYSDINGAETFAVAITVTNKKNEANYLKISEFRQYDPNGELQDPMALLNDLSWASELNSGETLEAQIQFIYEGNGEYTIMFNDGWGNGVIALLPISK